MGGWLSWFVECFLFSYEVVNHHSQDVNWCCAGGQHQIQHLSINYSGFQHCLLQRRRQAFVKL